MSCNCPKCSYNDTNTSAEPQRLINGAVEEIQQKLALNNDNDNGLALSPTEFKCIDTDGKIITFNSKEIPAGTLIDFGSKREAFRALVINKEDKPWMLYTNEKLSHEQFAKMMRDLTNCPEILHWGL